jgi:hypothetical protein
MRYLMMLPLCLAATACGGEEKATNAAAAIPATMAPGQYATDIEVTAFRSTDGRTPVLKAAVGDKSAGGGCLTTGNPPPELFASPGHKCSYKTTYIKDGMINASLGCKADGIDGDITMNVEGSYTATGFDATVKTNTYLPGAGDFEMSRKVKGTLTGPSCAPAVDAEGNSAAGNESAKAG